MLETENCPLTLTEASTTATAAVELADEITEIAAVAEEAAAVVVVVVVVVVVAVMVVVE